MNEGFLERGPGFVMDDLAIEDRIEQVAREFAERVLRTTFGFTDVPESRHEIYVLGAIEKADKDEP